VARALQILLEVAKSEKPLSFMDLYKQLALPKGTLHKLLYTLEALNFLRRDEDSGKYSTGLAVLELNARGLAKPGDLRSVLDPILHRLVEKWPLSSNRTENRVKPGYGSWRGSGRGRN
jgi:DNA-binding IclR family transcriptional regulator